MTTLEPHWMPAYSAADAGQFARFRLVKRETRLVFSLALLLELVAVYGGHGKQRVCAPRFGLRDSPKVRRRIGRAMRKARRGAP